MSTQKVTRTVKTTYEELDGERKIRQIPTSILTAMIADCIDNISIGGINFVLENDDNRNPSYNEGGSVHPFVVYKVSSDDFTFPSEFVKIIGYASSYDPVSFSSISFVKPKTVTVVDWS